MLTQLRRRVLLPLHESVIKGRRIAQYRRFLDQSQWWPREQLLAYQWKELGALLEHAYAHVPYWTQAFTALGMKPSDIRTPEDLRRLPITGKDDIRAHPDAMVADNYRGLNWRKSTGGSTGEPMVLEYTPLSYDWRVASSRRGYGWAGHEEGMKQFAVWGTPVHDRGWRTRLKERLHERTMGRLVVNCFECDDERMADWLERLNRYRPHTLVAYTTPLHNFALFIERHGGLRARVRVAIAAAEKLYEHQRRDIERVFGCRVFETYGSREFMLIGAECPQQQGLHISAENLFVEVIKDDGAPAQPGERGELVITDLHNYGQPFIRYRIGDLAIPGDESCPCGRGLPLLRQVVGRTLDMIHTVDGRHVPGEFFIYVMMTVKGIKQFQVVQEELESLVFNLVKKPSFVDGELAPAERDLRKVFGDKTRIEFRFVDDIPLTQTGKLRVSISRIGAKSPS